MKEKNSNGEIVKIVKVRSKKRNKRYRFSYINVIDVQLDKYFSIYEKLSQHREGCMTEEIFEKINNLLVEDYNNTINNLEHLAKKSLKYLKRKDKTERRKIFWYTFRRRLFFAKKNNEIEELISKREIYKFSMAKLFEDIISAKVREDVDQPEFVDNEGFDDEPDFVDDPKKLFSGPDEKRSLFGEVVEPQQLEEPKGDNSIALERLIEQ